MYLAKALKRDRFEVMIQGIPTLNVIPRLGVGAAGGGGGSDRDRLEDGAGRFGARMVLCEVSVLAVDSVMVSPEFRRRRVSVGVMLASSLDILTVEPPSLLVLPTDDVVETGRSSSTCEPDPKDAYGLMLGSALPLPLRSAGGMGKTRFRFGDGLVSILVYAGGATGEGCSCSSSSPDVAGVSGSVSWIPIPSPTGSTELRSKPRGGLPFSVFDRMDALEADGLNPLILFFGAMSPFGVGGSLRVEDLGVVLGLGDVIEEVDVAELRLGLSI